MLNMDVDDLLKKATGYALTLNMDPEDLLEKAIQCYIEQHPSVRCPCNRCQQLKKRLGL